MCESVWACGCVGGVCAGVSRTRMWACRNRRWNFGLIKDVLVDNVGAGSVGGGRDYGDLAGCLFGLNTLQQQNPINVTTTLQQ